MYYKRPSQKKFYNYLMPFFIITVIFVAIVFGWRALNDFFIDQKRSSLNEEVSLSIESGSAKAMTVGKGEWQNAPDNIPLYRGERLKTNSDGRATLTFFDQSVMRLNTSTEVAFASLKKKNETYEIEVELKKGDIWTKVEPVNNPDSNFSITTDLITIDTRGARFAVSSPSTVYMIEGSAQIGVKYDDEVIKTYTLGVGQQFLVEPDKIESIEKGENVEVIFALSDPFKNTNWYRWNTKKDGAINAFEEPEPKPEIEDEDGADKIIETEDITNIGRVAYVTKPSKNTETNKSHINVEGKLDPEKINAIYIGTKKATIVGSGEWKIESVKLNFEGKNEIKIEAEDLSGKRSKLDTLVVVYDKTPPSTPNITEPGSNDETITIEDVEQVIEGAVSEDTQAVIVNDYRLSKYVPGSKEFKYYAKTEIGNLEVGENEYKVYAEDKAGNQSEPAMIILELTQEVLDAAEEESDEEPEASADSDDESDETEENPLPPASSTGGVVITAPNDGESFETKETEFEIEGTVPEGTVKVVVNDYPLKLFNEGDTTFKYRTNTGIGNLVIGEKNTYTVKALDSSGSELGQATITIDVESGASAAPIITMPSASGSYTTTLDEIVIGGTVGKWVNRIYVNDKELTEYIPGSEKFSTTVKLSSGKNTFVVNAEKIGESAGKDTIEVTYQD